MGAKQQQNIPVIPLSSLSDSSFMLRPAGPRQVVWHHPHRDDYYMFGVILSGKQMLSVDFRELTIAEHQAIIVSPGQVHIPVGGVAPDGFVIAFAPESLTESEIALIEEYSLKPSSLTLSGEDFDDVKSLYHILLRRSNRGTKVEFSIASAIKGIVLQQIGKNGNAIPGRYKRLTIDFRNLLKENIRSEKHPSAYATKLNVSGVYLNEAIKNATGMSASSYIASFAMLIAKRELAYTNRTAQEIAYELGYEDYTYFSRQFRKQTGMSPRAFRQKYLE